MCEYVMPRTGIVLTPTDKPESSKRFNDLEGYERNRLRVGRYLGMARTQAMWEVFCACGRAVPMSRKAMTNPKIKSCGCFMKERLTTHGMKGKRVYRIWMAMKGRCETPSNGNYGPYGGSGIKIYPEWSRSFEAFLRDVGDCPSEAHTIDRFPNQSGNYEPGNVRWATPIEQGSNQKTNTLLTIEGVTKTLAQWSRASEVNRATISDRLEHGWDVKSAVWTKPGTQPRRKRSESGQAKI